MTARIRPRQCPSAVALGLVLAASGLFTTGATSTPAFAPQVRGATIRPVGTGRIRGVVHGDDARGAPIRRAIVTLSGGDLGQSRSVVTGDDGRFELDGLPPGRFTLSATKPGYLPASYGARRPGRQGTSIALAAGGRLDVALTMTRGAVLAGVVRDEHGRPAANVTVLAASTRDLDGGAASARPIEVRTNHRGEYRLYGLAPGEYVVAANPLEQRSPAFDQRNEAEMDAILAALRQRGAAGATRARDAAPTAGDEAPAGAWGFPLVFYPGTPAYGAAEHVRVAAGETRPGLDVIIAPVRMTTIDGTITSADGRPPGRLELAMVVDGPQAPVFTGSRPVLSQPPDDEGRFRYTNVPPGRYHLQVNETDEPRQTSVSRGVGSSSGGGFAPPAPDDRQRRYAVADVDVTGQPITGVSLVLQPGATITGRLEVRAASGDASIDLSRIQVGLSPIGEGGMSSISGTVFRGTVGTARAGSVQADGSFTVTGVGPGSYLVRRVLPADVAATWWTPSAMLDGVDRLDVPLEVRGSRDFSGLVLALTDRHTELTGSLQTPAGAAAPDYFIVVFSADPALRGRDSRRVVTVRPGTDGRFTARDLPPGDYRLAALLDVEPSDVDDPTFFDQLAPASIPIVIRDGERTVQDVRIGG